MKDTSSRIALLLLGLALSALAVKWALTDRPASERPEGAPVAPAGTAGTGSDWDPNADRVRAAAEQQRSAASEGTAELDALLPRRQVGPPLEKGTPVDVSVRWKQGTVTRYRIMTVSSQRDRETGLSAGQRLTFEVRTTVEAAGENGTARVRLDVERLRIDALHPDGVAIRYDSADPEEDQLADPGRALAVQPLLVMLRSPIELSLAQNGGCTAVEGLDAWNDEWVEVVERLNPGSSRQSVSPYTPETMLFQWSELLFPPVLGGTLEAGAERDVQILTDTLQGAYVEHRGPLRVTHDEDGVFRLKLECGARAIARQGAPRSPQEAAVAKVHVQGDFDAYKAAWRFARDPGRIVDGEIDTRYQLWVSWTMGESAQGGDTFERRFLDVERVTRVERIEE